MPFVPAGISAATIASGVTAAAAVGGLALNAFNSGGSPGSPGSASSGQTNNATTEMNHNPWGPQGPAISTGLDQAGQVMTDRNAQGAYTGALYGGLGADQNAAIGGVNQYVANYGTNAVGRADQQGYDATNSLGYGINAANGVAQNGIGPQNAGLAGALNGYGTGTIRSVAQPLSDALHASATAGAASLGGYNAGLGGIMQSGQTDNTGQLVGDAQSVMNGGASQQMMQNVHNQIGATLNETTVPGLNRQAAMGGNLNSSRAGMAEAMANRDAALTEGNADAQIQNNAFNTGLNTAASQHTAGLNTALGAASAGMSGNSNLALGTGNQDIAQAQTAIGAATSGLGQDTNYGLANANARLGGAGQLISGANTGLAADRSAQALATGNANMLNSAGQVQAGDQQAKTTQAYQQYQIGNTYRQGVLNDYMNNVTKPQGYYQSTGSTTGAQTLTPPSSIGNLLAGGGAAIGSLLAGGWSSDPSSTQGAGSPAIENSYNPETGF